MSGCLRRTKGSPVIPTREPFRFLPCLLLLNELGLAGGCERGPGFFRMTERTRGRTWQRIRAQVLSRAPLCIECERVGRTQLADEVDHIVPISRGGSDRLDNLQPLCREHHAQKSALEAGKQWRFGCDESGRPLDPASHWNRE